MSSAQIALLGAIAGLTIYLGLPLGRIRTPMPKLKALLNAIAVGILTFLLWDVLSKAWEPVAVRAAGQEHSSAPLGKGLVFACASPSGWSASSSSSAGRSGGPCATNGPGAMTATELGHAQQPRSKTSTGPAGH